MEEMDPGTVEAASFLSLSFFLPTLCFEESILILLYYISVLRLLILLCTMKSIWSLLRLL